jgi:N6-adenosine-specific RNA methylase IME4
VTWPGLTPPYRCIAVDPPWALQAPGLGWGSDARRHYALMTVEEIKALPVQELADPTGCHLWLWAICSMVEEAHQVARAWGFRPVTMLTWCKTGQPGVGHYVRVNTEHVILATMGEPMTPAEKPMASWFTAPRTHSGRFAHSRKPGAAFDLFEQVSPGPRVELFQRQGRLGWDGHGWGYEGQVSA